MILNLTLPQFQTDPSFPQQVDLKNILPFINPIPNLNLLIPSPNNNFKQLFIDSKQKILQNKKQINEFITKTTRLIQVAEYDVQHSKINDSIKNLKKIEITPEKISQIRKLEILYLKYNSLLPLYKKALNNFQSTKERFISDFLLVCEWLISNPQPFYINIDSAFPDISLQFYSQNRELIKHFNMLEYALKLQLKYISLLPDQLFCGSEDMNRNFFKNALQTALNQKKNDTSYFEPLKCEETLFLFFQSSSSPIFTKIKELESIKNFSTPFLRKSGIERENNSKLNNFVLNWIKEASQIILNFEEKNQKEIISEDDRKLKLDAIEILIVRFVFDLTFPYLNWQPLPDISFSRQIEQLSKKTARNLQISLNFIHPELADVECTMMFNRDSISRAPVQWLTSAQYEVCPIRAAYCMTKVHESLTMMATIAADDNELLLKNSNKNKSFQISHQNQSSQNSNENQSSQNSNENQSSQNSYQNKSFQNSHQNQSSQNSNIFQGSQNSNIFQGSQNQYQNKSFQNSHQNQSSQNSNSIQGSQNSYNIQVSNNSNDNQTELLDPSSIDKDSKVTDKSAAQRFFSKVPGFDDIFNFWVSLVCSAKLADPRGLNQFIKDWSNLPGFSSRARAACTYFEAAIAHIESGEAIEKCQK